MPFLSVLSGSLVGLSVSLTGGGGAAFAVPLLVYVLHVPSRIAIGVSLVTVCATSFVGFLQRMRSGLVEVPTGLLFAAAGIVSAPLGAWIARRMPPALLLVLFGALMVTISTRMWRAAKEGKPSSDGMPMDEDSGPACRRDADGKLRLSSRCALKLGAVGFSTGALTGLFGLGGGIIVVPALVTFSGMAIQRAMATSLMIITLVSLSGISSYFIAGDAIPVDTTLLFLGGSLLGLFLGTMIASKLSGPRLMRFFSIAIFCVGVFVIVRNVWH